MSLFLDCPLHDQNSEKLAHHILPSRIRELEVPNQFQAAQIDATWTRLIPTNGGLFHPSSLKDKKYYRCKFQASTHLSLGLASCSQPTAERPHRLTQHSHIQPTIHFVAGLSFSSPLSRSFQCYCQEAGEGERTLSVKVIPRHSLHSSAPGGEHECVTHATLSGTRRNSLSAKNPGASASSSTCNLPRDQNEACLRARLLRSHHDANTNRKLLTVRFTDP